MINPGVNPTERIFSPQTVCVPATGVYIARALKGLSVPGTKAEVLALATDMGTPNGVGANFTKLAAGMLKRYGLKGSVHEGAAAALSAINATGALGPMVVGVAGNQANLSPSWQPGNNIGHAICVLYPFFPGIQLDPLAPAGYSGDTFDSAEFTKFVTAAIIFTDYPDCSAQVKAATDALNAKIAAAKKALA